MRYLKKYNESEQTFDVEFVITKIREEFSEDRVCEMFDNEVLEWVDPDWADDYDSEYDWYIDHNNGEAQDVVIGQLIDWYTSKFGSINVEQQIELNHRIKEEYSALNY